jgi:glucosamine-6-phosphate deaminase
VEVVITEDARAAAQVAADAIERLLMASPSAVLGLATGSSPLPTYSELIARHQRGRVSFARARCFLLDEYLGLEEGHSETYRAFIRRELIDHVDLAADALFGPDGGPDDPMTAGTRYEQQISAAGGIDLQILGIGTDGHIGFNEPVSSLGSRTRLKTLTHATRSDNARFFDGNIDLVPRHAITQGIGTILESRHLLLIATGDGKAVPVARAIEGAISAMLPASALQLHPHVTVIVDQAAAGELTQASYYREAYENKPPWQHI